MAIYKPSLLDKFKDFVNGLRSNWDQYEAHVADFEAHVADFEAHLAESAQKHITESGENANGRYVRFDDGTQICYYSGTKTIGINNAYGSLFQGGVYVYYFAVEFASTPAVAIGRTQWGTGASWGSVSDATTSYVCLRFIDAFSRPSDSMDISYIAIGRWK